jgi:hypothetical protein
MTIGDFERATLKRIYEAAKAFVEVPNPVRLNEVVISMVDGPIGGIRGLQVKNAEATARALEAAGWVRTEMGGNTVDVRLTDAGIRAAQQM